MGWDWDELLGDALYMGLTVAEFWAMTPRELAIASDAAVRRQKREQRRDAWIAWHIGALQRVKRLPSLKQLMGEMQTRALSPDEAQRRKQEHNELVSRYESAKHGKK